MANLTSQKLANEAERKCPEKTLAGKFFAILASPNFQKLAKKVSLEIALTAPKYQLNAM